MEVYYFKGRVDSMDEISVGIRVTVDVVFVASVQKGWNMFVRWFVSTLHKIRKVCMKIYHSLLFHARHRDCGWKYDVQKMAANIGSTLLRISYHI